MLWAIRSFPACRHHVFLSHSAEDRDTLVVPVYQVLSSRGMKPWLDRHHYSYGRDSRSALRGAILECRHVVFFVTDALLNSARGWCVQELAWAELVQSNLVVPGGDRVVHVTLPLLFVRRDDPRLPRSVWQATRDQGRFHDPSHDPPAAQWAAAQIEAFLRREEAAAQGFKSLAKKDDKFKTQLRATPGFEARVTRFDPRPLPAAP